jgi:membrane protein insertase Oxa1/YidC/SpoIIIJ
MARTQIPIFIALFHVLRRLRPDGQRNLFLVIIRRETALSTEAKAKTPA